MANEGEHQAVSSEDDGRDEGGYEEAVESDNGGHDAVSSEGNGGDGGAAAGELVENGHEMAIHGGGTLEDVEGFDAAAAMTEGLADGELVPVGAELAALPECCPADFEEPESVCGNDDRVRIRSTTRIPWRWHAQLIITLRNGRRSRCTGWFIGPHTVMTAGHCVYSHANGGWAHVPPAVLHAGHLWRSQRQPGVEARERPGPCSRRPCLRRVPEQGHPDHQRGVQQHGQLEAVATREVDVARLRGKITGIMESWPLQLTIRDDEGHDHAISLEEDTAVVTRAGVVGPGELREGQRVEVEVADDTGGDGLTTDDIVLLE